MKSLHYKWLIKVRHEISNLIPSKLERPRTDMHDIHIVSELALHVLPLAQL